MSALPVESSTVVGSSYWYPPYQPTYVPPTYTYIQAPSLTEDQVRRIVREELDAAIERLAERMKGGQDA